MPITFCDDDDRHARHRRHPAVRRVLQQGRDPAPARSSRTSWSRALAAFAALMTAFYMFRLMSLTFFGAYRGPAWETAGHGHGGARGARRAVPADARPWRPRRLARAARVAERDDVPAGGAGGRRGAGRVRRRAAALGGGNAIEHFLHPSFAGRASLAIRVGRSDGGQRRLSRRRPGTGRAGAAGRRPRARRTRRRSRAGERSRPPSCRTPASSC